VAAVVWTTRLDALRAMQSQDEFELAALDYCITFEVAPPPWQPARCTYTDSTSNEESAAAVDAQDVNKAISPRGLESGHPAPMELRGQVVGDAMAALSALRNDFPAGSHLVVSCQSLLRVDFSAAGSILNWAAMRHSQGCQVQFRDVHRLVAAFFNVIGINEYAKVVPRAIE